MKTLIFIPTYNERENVAHMCAQLAGLGLGADILFLDDNSPDGTGKVLDELAVKHPNMTVIHRSGKLGVGSAHLDGIAWAYERGYERLITLDCDFTHSPTDIFKLLQFAGEFDVVLGSRFLEKDSLPDWSLYRRFMTHSGYILTRWLLNVPQDATGAFRIYNLSRIPHRLFQMVKSRGYSFFFESLFLLTHNGFAVKDVPIVLPTRTYGNSKMSNQDVQRSVSRLLALAWAKSTNPKQFQLQGWSRTLPIAINPALKDPQGWDVYWNQKTDAGSTLYECIATFYRKNFIKRRLDKMIRCHFPPGSSLLHAGCGTGLVDADIQSEMRLTAVDISVPALTFYQKNVPHAACIKHASIFDLPFAENTFDGVYNLGVMEHFTESEIRKILADFHRVLKPGGRLVLFWPHARATSVAFLGAVHWVANRIFKKNLRLHPAEISFVRSRSHAQSLLQQTQFEMLDYHFGPADLFVQAVIVARKK